MKHHTSPGLLCLIVCALISGLLLFQPAHAENLEIRNQSNAEILNIFVQPTQKKAESIFMRLDLLPGAADKVENPACLAKLRVDTGLQLWLYESVALEDVQALLFCSDYPACLALLYRNGQKEYQAVSIRNLVPAPGEKPVCELGSFRPLMPMKEVCALLDADIPHDDNGACLAGLGFAGKLWAARLFPFQNGPITGDSLLEHMELRKGLSQTDVADVLDALYKQKYTPWQAEFPGLDMDFANMSSMGEQERRDLLMSAIDSFLKAQALKKPSPQINNATDEEAEASILMAPADSLSALANADNPPQDVQLFTLVLKPLSSTLLLDVSAYQAGQ